MTTFVKIRTQDALFGNMYRIASLTDVCKAGANSFSLSLSLWVSIHCMCPGHLRFPSGFMARGGVLFADGFEVIQLLSILGRDALLVVVF